MLSKDGEYLLKSHQIELIKRGYFEQYFQLTHNNKYPLYPYVKIMCGICNRILAGEEVKAMIWLPPQHLKTTTITETFPSCFLGNNPEKSVMLLSYNDDSAKKFGIRNREKFGRYGKDIWDLEVSKQRSENKYWEIEGHTGKLISAGFGGSITGEGADLLIIDDPVKNRQEAYSKTVRDTNWNEYISTVDTRIHQGASRIVIQTRWHDDDLSGRILKIENDWEIYKFPALALENDPLGRKEGEALCPTWMDAETLLKKKSLQQGEFESLYQQNPVPESGNIFQRKWFGYYRRLPEQFDMVIDSWDLAFKDMDSSDYVACGVWGKLGPNLYLIDRKKGHWGFTATLREMKAIREQHPYIDGTLVEDKANGSAVMDVLKREISSIVSVEPNGSKEARAYAASPTIEAGNVLLPEGAPWVEEYLEEMIRFPSAPHDDEVDQTSQAINYMIKGELYFTTVKRS